MRDVIAAVTNISASRMQADVFAVAGNGLN